MSRIGRAPIAIPAGVTVTVGSGNEIHVKGPKGELTQTVSPLMEVKVDGGVVTVSRPNDEALNRSLHGLTRSLINNMVIGVTEGFSKTLEINGVGYRAAKEGKNLVMNLGYSHQVTVPDTDDITTEVPNPNQVIVKGIDKQKVGQFAAEVRAKRPPEPYKGKGIKYVDEVLIHKEGKTGAK
ncbi:MAG: 50S ribosomal protein L6 [Oscillospiraceae bacterium]|nr:50S ribosomal protein L6 [Oscillospiraceae bacterium]